MGKFSTIKCWFVADSVTDPQSLSKEQPDLALIKKSILKNGYRGFAVEEREAIEAQPWYSAFLLGEEVRFYIDGSGVYRLVNCDLTENELYFERLNVPVGFRPWIFYGWQSDWNPSRSDVKEALEASVNHINGSLSPRQTLSIVESTRDEDGARSIVEAIKQNIDRSMLAVFDVTNVSRVVRNGTSADTASDEKHYPNANVVFELSYALARKRSDQIILVKKSRKVDFGGDHVPFDFEQNRRIDYDKPANLKKDLKELLVRYFRRIAFIRENG